MSWNISIPNLHLHIYSGCFCKSYVRNVDICVHFVLSEEGAFIGDGWTDVGSARRNEKFSKKSQLDRRLQRYVYGCDTNLS